MSIDVANMQPGRSIYDSMALKNVPDVALYPLVAVADTKRTSKTNKNKEAPKEQKRASTVFVQYPQFYNVEFHKAIAKIRAFDGLGGPGGGISHAFLNLYLPNAQGKFFVATKGAERFFFFCILSYV